MSCADINLSASLGETFRRDVVYKDSLGVAIDISTWTAFWTVGDTTYFSPSTNVTIGPEAGTIHLLLTTAQVADLGYLTDYRLSVTDPVPPVGEGDILLLEGRLEVV